jgi:hypothetical protein
MKLARRILFILAALLLVFAAWVLWYYRPTLEYVR